MGQKCLQVQQRPNNQKDEFHSRQQSKKPMKSQFMKRSPNKEQIEQIKKPKQQQQFAFNVLHQKNDQDRQIHSEQQEGPLHIIPLSQEQQIIKQQNDETIKQLRKLINFKFQKENVKPVLQWKWQWQSNNNPWDKNQAIKWSRYSSEVNNRINQAYSQKLGSVQVNQDHFIDFKTMLQIKTDDHSKQRRVRNNKHKCSRDHRFNGKLEIAQTYSLPFGNRTDLKNYLEKYGAKKYNYGKAITDLETQFRQLQNANRMSQKEINLTSNILENLRKLYKDYDNQHKFYDTKLDQAIQKSYTEESFIYKSVNKALREINHDEIYKFRNYIYMLVESFPWKVVKEPFTLYRGTSLPREQALKDYDKQTNTQFSWMCFVSTSRDFKQVVNFIQPPNLEKIPVVFIINVPQNKYQDNLLDLSKVSNFPYEQEVLILPGTIFEIIDTLFVDDVLFVQIQIKVKSSQQKQSGKLQQQAFVFESCINKGGQLDLTDYQLDLNELMQLISTKVKCLENFVLKYNDRYFKDIIEEVKITTAYAIEVRDIDRIDKERFRQIFTYHGFKRISLYLDQDFQDINTLIQTTNFVTQKLDKLTINITFISDYQTLKNQIINLFNRNIMKCFELKIAYKVDDESNEFDEKELLSLFDDYQSIYIEIVKQEAWKYYIEISFSE